MDNELKKFVRSKEAELSSVAAVRAENGMKFDRPGDSRLSSDVDYARVLYSASFRRLQGKMQLFAPGSLNFHRNRLTHSLEVAQVARSIAKRL